jgi:hypothetical protein
VTDAANVVTGHSWMQADRSAGAAYVEDPPPTPGSTNSPQITYEDLYARWQQVLKFVVGGRDSE